MTDDKLFSSKKDSGLGDLVKKARRKSLIKTISISLVVSIVVLFSLYWTGSYVIQRQINQSTDDALWSMVRGANVEGTGASYTYSFTSAIETRDLVKKIGGVSLAWGAEETEYTMFGTKKLLSSVTSIHISQEAGERAIPYFQGERVIEFYHPEVEYQEVYDDRPLLENIPEYMVAEMAFSFDQPYSLQEVVDVFGDQLEWYWVDDFSKEDVKDHNEMNRVREDEEYHFNHLIMGNGTYGFPFYEGSTAKESAQSFIHTLEYVKEQSNEYEYEVDQVINAITNHGDKDLAPENVEVIGVVVTGTAEELSQFDNVEMVRGSTLGATAKRFE
ncbi:anti sigma factor C-terminal domain-containing protein [Alkalihalophilus lindianensis]|uniref:Anti sigma factor C-terminal domain-containing protein n=1 Tax=Alkalihalophilus lindianensis TaxID=1630542 RepID=A0ABU3XDR1_9BACI|nr:anti sigma factor C-terminal domain-containing protein [Alkalihalophilus lindianensis]MDV2686026.1 anti sigma factor C-terminal domain-containing protein [Alkalihalophilus lindianensis]